MDPILIDTELRQIAGAVRSYKWQAADLVIRMEQCQGWKELGYKNKTAWLKSFKESRSALYGAAKQRKELAQFSVQTLDTLTQENLKYLKFLPESKRQDPEVLEKAKGTEAEFVEYLNSTHSLHINCGRKLVIDFEDQGQYEDVSQAIKDYCQREGVGRSQALWEMVQG